MLDLIRKLVPDPNARKVKTMQPIVDHINDLEAEIQKLSDDELRGKTIEFRQMLANRERADNLKQDRLWEQQMLDNLLPEAFAVVREASKRVLNMRHFDVQLIGGMVLHQGGIAEMRTGEGKTLVATLPAYLNALTGKGVHVITVNDYLAKRDGEWMGQLYQFLGLSVGMVLSEQRGFNSFELKKQAYNADITYGTNNEFGFDYLRDNMAGSKSQLCQRAFNFAVIDEVDSILIDEARTPLIISGRLEQSADLYRSMARIAPALTREDDYTVDEKGRNVVMTEEGIDRAQELLNVDDLFDIQNNWAHYVLQALKAKELFKRDIDYIVKDGEIVIVDEFTGRLMEGRRWSDGLHQSVEAKEGLQIQDETQTLASITFQNLFRLYPKLSGMTGTAMTEEAEFGKIYNLSVTTIPTNRSDVRQNIPDTIFKNEKVKYFKAVEEIIDYHELGRPVLIGTVSIEKSEELSKMLTTPVYMTQHLREKASRVLKALEDGKETTILQTLTPYLKSPEMYDKADFDKLATQFKDKGELPDLLNSIGTTAKVAHAIQRGVPHHVLNAKQHEKEAYIVAQAGRYKAVTIATNMAGRGTDILLGGNAEFLAKQELSEEGRDWRDIDEEIMTRLVAAKKSITEDEKQKVVALGGLHIIGTERHESRRIDNQLRGRAARQGDPGSTHFFLSLEDSLMRKFGGDKIAGMMDMLGVDEAMPISHGMVTRAIEGAQRKVEAYFFDIRKNILQYDDVLTEQRKLIYEQRRKVLNGENLRASTRHMVEQVMERLVYSHVAPNSTSEDWDDETKTAMLNEINGLTHRFAHLDDSILKNTSAHKLVSLLKAEGLIIYEKLEDELTDIAQDLNVQHGMTLAGLEDELDTDPRDSDGKPLSESQLQEIRHPLRRIERDVLLSVIDQRWIDYLHQLDHLREGIGLRAYGQKDPLNEYKAEAFAMFQQLTYQIQSDTVLMLYNTRIELQPMEDHHIPIDGIEALPEEFEMHETPLTQAAEHFAQNMPGSDA